MFPSYTYKLVVYVLLSYNYSTSDQKMQIQGEFYLVSSRFFTLNSLLIPHALITRLSRRDTSAYFSQYAANDTTAHLSSNPAPENPTSASESLTPAYINVKIIHISQYL